jgi:hypothetical protein
MALSNPLESSSKDSINKDDSKILKEGYRIIDRPSDTDRVVVKLVKDKLERRFINERL